VWLVSFRAVPANGPKNVVRLGFRDEQTYREVGVLSGVLDRSALAVQAGYREHSMPVPVPFASSVRPSRGAVAVLFLMGLGFDGFDCWNYVRLKDAELAHRSCTLDQLSGLLYAVGGKIQCS
jgi:hypothetical protein